MKKAKQVKSIKIDQSYVDTLKQLTDCHTYKISTELFTQGNTPFVAYLLVEGTIQLHRNKKIAQTIQPGTIIGLKELMEHTPSDFTANILPGGTVYHIDRSTILEIIDHRDDSLKTVIEEALVS